MDSSPDLSPFLLDLDLGSKDSGLGLGLESYGLGLGLESYGLGLGLGIEGSASKSFFQVLHVYKIGL